MIKPKKYITISIGILIAIYGGITNIISVKAESNKESTTGNMLNNKYNKLIHNKNWTNIKKFWKKINAIDIKEQNNSNFKNLQTLQEQLEKIKNNIEALKTLNLITLEQSQYLSNFIHARLSYLNYAMGRILCYKMSLIGAEVVKKRADLEKQYDILEKIFNENKIDQKTFELTKAKIIEDINFIDENTSINPKTENIEGMTDLLILLNK